MKRPDTAKRPRLHRTWLHEILETLLLIAAAYILINLISARYQVQGPSMYPNFADHEVLFVSRLHYLLGKPERLDIVVFHFPDNPQDDYIKRIIGLPGEIVELRHTQVYINGRALDEPYLYEACLPGRCPDRLWVLGPDEFFVMGDNRNESSDSRAFGPIRRKFIVGEVLARYWPPSAWGLVARIGAPDTTPGR